MEQLCKSIVLENVFSKVDGCEDPTNSRYAGSEGSSGVPASHPPPPPSAAPRFYIVVLQYVSELNTESLQTLVRELRPKETRIPRRGIKLRLAKDEVRALPHVPTEAGGALSAG